ncbi:MAG: hypothetical protein ACXWT3_11160 [Methylococcaceae bacterium]
MTTIFISDKKELIDEAILGATIDIICSIDNGIPKIVKNRIPYIRNELIQDFLLKVVDDINPLSKLLNSCPVNNKKLSATADFSAATGLQPEYRKPNSPEPKRPNVK